MAPDERSRYAEGSFTTETRRGHGVFLARIDGISGIRTGSGKQFQEIVRSDRSPRSRRSWQRSPCALRVLCVSVMSTVRSAFHRPVAAPLRLPKRRDAEADPRIASLP